jgi:hypothetical protein
MGINTTSVSTSVLADGNLTVLGAPASVLAAGKKLTDLKVSDLTAQTFLDLTYDFTAGSGWADGRTQESVNDDRLTAPTVFTKPGKITDTLTSQYVYGGEDNVADPLLVEGAFVVFAVRWAVPHDQAISADDKWDLWYVQCGVKAKDQPAANGVFTKTQSFFIQKFRVQRDVKLAAA